MRRVLPPIAAALVVWQIVQAHWPLAVLAAVLLVWLVSRDIPPRVVQATSVIAGAALVAQAAQSDLPWWASVLGAAAGVALVYVFVIAFAVRLGTRPPSTR